MLADSRREAFQLSPYGFGGVTGVAVGYVRVGPDGVDVSERPYGVGEVLLRDKNKRAFGHAAVRDGPLRMGNFLQRATQMHGPGASAGLVTPRHSTLDGQVDFEGRRPVCPAGVSALSTHGQSIAAQGESGERGCVEQGDTAGGQFAQGAYPDPGLNGPAEFMQAGSQGMGDSLRAAVCNWPAEAMPGCYEHERDGGASGCRQRAHRVRGDAGEQGSSPGSVPAVRDRGRGARGEDAETGESHGVSGQVERRSHQLGGQGVEMMRQRSEETPPCGSVSAETACGVVQRTLQHCCRASVEWVRQVDLGSAPLKPVPLQCE